LRASLRSQHGQLLGNAGFADAWFPGKHHYPPMAGQGITKGRLEHRQFLLAADENASRL
jgi:hypothetical protein